MIFIVTHNHLPKEEQAIYEATMLSRRSDTMETHKPNKNKRQSEKTPAINAAPQ